MTFEFCFTPNLRKTEIRLDHLIAESIPHASWRKIKFELSFQQNNSTDSDQDHGNVMGQESQ